MRPGTNHTRRATEQDARMAVEHQTRDVTATNWRGAAPAALRASAGQRACRARSGLVRVCAVLQRRPAGRAYTRRKQTRSRSRRTEPPTSNTRVSSLLTPAHAAAREQYSLPAPRRRIMRALCIPRCTSCTESSRSRACTKASAFTPGGQPAGRLAIRLGQGYTLV